jgi:hypothetical protein
MRHAMGASCPRARVEFPDQPESLRDVIRSACPIRLLKLTQDPLKSPSAVRSGQWAKKPKEDLRYLFANHVIPIAGSQPLRDVTLVSLSVAPQHDCGGRISEV